MKKQILILLLCLCLLVSAVPVSAASDVCFIAVNDSLLDLGSVPYIYGGVVYLPYWVFSDYGFGIYFNYFSDGSTAAVYNEDKQLYFELGTEKTYDNSGKTYTYRAVMRNGSVYLPVKLMCSFFGGLTCSYIAGSDYGDVVRLRDARAVLTDSQFVKAASTLMQSRYDAVKNGSGTVIQTEAPVQTLSPAVREGTTGVLSFIGLPTETILTALRRNGASACFFLTENDVLSNPALIRRLCGEGHTPGIFIGSADDISDTFRRVQDLIYEAAHVRTVLVCSLDAQQELEERAFELGASVWSYDVDCMSTETVRVSGERIISLLSRREGDSSLFFSCDDATDLFIQPLLKYMADSRFILRASKETDDWSLW